MKARIRAVPAASDPGERSHSRHWAVALIALTLASWVVTIGAAKLIRGLI